MYISETRRRLGTQIKKYKDAYRKQELGKSASKEYVRIHQHPILWEATSVIVEQANGEDSL